jgi:membrane fusion protein, multidrug efflux system
VNKRQVGATASNLASRQADVEYAKLQLSYTVIIAPASGVVSKRNIQLGQLVQAAQTLFAIVNGNGIYVTANFKETQMEPLRIGQKVDVSVDAFPDSTFRGSIESFSGATGAKFSLLPPDNATGNFVKVVQRVPVRIKIDTDSSLVKLLRAGMSVDVVVYTK